MTELETILVCICAFSIILNIGVFVYARSAISRLLYVAEELSDLKMMVDSFSTHVSSLYEMEMYYGDQTLQELVDHAQSFNEQLRTFEFIYTLMEADEIEEEIEQIEKENRTDTPQAEES